MVRPLWSLARPPGLALPLPSHLLKLARMSRVMATAARPTRLANGWASKAMHVTAIGPGYIRTDNTKALQQAETRNRQILERIPAGRWGEPADLAGAAVFLASPASDYVQGHVMVIDGGWMGR